VSLGTEDLDNNLAGHLGPYCEIRSTQSIDHRWCFFADGVFDLQIAWDGDFFPSALPPYLSVFASPVQGP